MLVAPQAESCHARPPASWDFCFSSTGRRAAAVAKGQIGATRPDCSGTAKIRHTRAMPWADGRRRAVATVLLVVVLTLPLLACGSSGAAGSTSKSHRVISGAFCAVTAYQLYHDVKAHRLGWAAFQAVLAQHNCRQAFRRP